MEKGMNANFCFKMGKAPVDTYEMLQTLCGDETLNRNSGCEWFKRVKDVYVCVCRVIQEAVVLQPLEMQTVANVREVAVSLSG
jgi:hypothetical protein